MRGGGGKKGGGGGGGTYSKGVEIGEAICMKNYKHQKGQLLRDD